MRVLLELIEIIEQADENVMDVDLSMKWLEGAAAELRSLPPDGRMRLAAVASELAEERQRKGPAGSDAFYRTFMADFGWRTSAGGLRPISMTGSLPPNLRIGGLSGPDAPDRVTFADGERRGRALP